jgi:hypothetical protein
MLSFLKKLFGFSSAPVTEVAPYKVKTPSVVAFGEPPATVVIPVAGLMLPVEGAGVVEVAPKKKAPKPAAGTGKTVRAPRAKKAPKAK